MLHFKLILKSLDTLDIILFNVMTKTSIYYTVDASIIKRCSENFIMSNNQLTQASVKRLFEENKMVRPFIKKFGLKRLRIKRNFLYGMWTIQHFL